MIYLTICTYWLYAKFKKQSKQGNDLSVQYKLTSVGDPDCTVVQNAPQPQAYQQPPNPQHNSKFAEANQLPSYDSVTPSAPQI